MSGNIGLNSNFKDRYIFTQSIHNPTVTTYWNADGTCSFTSGIFSEITLGGTDLVEYIDSRAAQTTIDIGTVTAVEFGEPLSVVNSGTEQHAILDFTLPKGPSGDDGANATIEVGDVTTVPYGGTASVTNSGTAINAVLDFVFIDGQKGDTGDQGETGEKGDQGDPGDNATIEIGDVTSIAYGGVPSVTNSGTLTNAILDFILITGPKGDKGDQGDKGDKGNKGDKGDKGDTGDTGPAGSDGDVLAALAALGLSLGAITAALALASAVATLQGEVAVLQDEVLELQGQVATLTERIQATEDVNLDQEARINALEAKCQNFTAIAGLTTFNSASSIALTFGDIYGVNNVNAVNVIYYFDNLPTTGLNQI